MSHTAANAAGAVAPRVRSWNLALVFQEALTAILRLRFGRDSVSDSEGFRAQIKSILRAASQDGEARGYSSDEIRTAMFAVVAFLDESVLTSHNPAFSGWPRLPLQEELFGEHVAGEVFFHNLRSVLARADSPRAFDVLEVYYLCLLLGYKGRYGASGSGELRAIMETVREKIGRFPQRVLSACAAIPVEAERRPEFDPLVRVFQFAALASLLLAVCLFVSFKIILL